MKFGRVLVLSLAALLIAAPAVYAQDDDMGDLTTKKPAKRQRTTAEETNDPTRAGAILGVGATFAHENFDGTGMDLEDSGGFNARVGYRFNRWVATVLEVERYQQFHGEDFSTRADIGDVNGWAVGLNGVFYPIGGPYQPFAEIGINYLDMERTNNSLSSPNDEKTYDGPAFRFGVGLDVYATNKFLVTTDLSYMLGISQVQDYGLLALSLGIAFRP